MKRTARLIFAALILPVLFTGCINIRYKSGPRNTVSPSHGPSTALPDEDKAFWEKAYSLIGYYEEIALRSEYGDSDRKVHKWIETVVLYLKPSEDADKYSGFLKQHIGFLNGIDNFPGIVITDDQDKANLTLEFVTKYEMGKISGKFEKNSYGFSTVSWYNGDGRIFKGSVYILRETDCSEADVKHTIVEELTQSMGLMNDSKKYPDSIFYQGYSTSETLSDIDVTLFKMHYSPLVRTGADIREIRAAVEKLLAN